MVTPKKDQSKIFLDGEIRESNKAIPCRYTQRPTIDDVVNELRTPSSSSSQRRTRKTMQPVSTESVANDHDQPQPNCQKKDITAGNSTLKYLQSHKMFSQNSHIPGMNNTRNE